MGRINKALNRSNYKQTHRPGASSWHKQQFDQRQQEREDKKDLKLIQISEEQQTRKDLKVVYKLPQNTKAV